MKETREPVISFINAEKVEQEENPPTHFDMIKIHLAYVYYCKQDTAYINAQLQRPGYIILHKICQKKHQTLNFLITPHIFFKTKLNKTDL